LYWRNSYTLFSHAIAITKNNALAEDNLGEALVELGHPELAATHFQAAIRIAPAVSTAHYNLGTVMQQQGQLELARREYETTLLFSADSTELAQTHNNLGALLTQIGDQVAAKSQFDAALSINPDEVNSLIGRGLIEYQQHAWNVALLDFARASQLGPSPLALFWKGRALEEQGKFSDAAAAYEQALHLAPRLEPARLRLNSIRSKSD
jgi:tetratricopeptide (TPR) repeat protein